MKNLTKELESIIHKVVLSHPLPYKKGKHIRIGPVIIRESKTQGFILFDSLKQKQLAVTYSKSAALAVAKCYLKDQDYSDVIRLDKVFQKYDIDCIFYKHIIEKTNDVFLKNVNTDRLDIAVHKVQDVKQNIEDILFDK